jgi:hypothetical protein
VPSTTTIGGRRAIRAAVVNHRTVPADADIMLDGLLALLDRRLSTDPAASGVDPERMDRSEGVGEF